MNLRRISDSDLINELQARGYSVRRPTDARRQLIVEALGEDITVSWKQAALEAIRGKLSLDDLHFETVPTAAGIDLSRAALRIL